MSLSFASNGRVLRQCVAALVVGTRSPFFAEGVHLRPCDGGWRCAVDEPTNAPGLLRRDGKADFCDVDVLETDDVRSHVIFVRFACAPIQYVAQCCCLQLTAELFHSVYRNRRPLLLRKGKHGPEPWMTRGPQGTEGLFRRTQVLKVTVMHLGPGADGVCIPVCPPFFFLHSC